MSTLLSAHNEGLRARSVRKGWWGWTSSSLSMWERGTVADVMLLSCSSLRESRPTNEMGRKRNVGFDVGLIAEIDFMAGRASLGKTNSCSYPPFVKYSASSLVIYSNILRGDLTLVTLHQSHDYTSTHKLLRGKTPHVYFSSTFSKCLLSARVQSYWFIWSYWSIWG